MAVPALLCRTGVELEPAGFGVSRDGVPIRLSPEEFSAFEVVVHS